MNTLPHNQYAYPAQYPGDRQHQYSGNDTKYRYELQVVQQPARARMCGFGDKDRRPITPPPCIQLIVTDCKTGKRVPAEQVQSSFFILQADLWCREAKREVNLVRHSSTAPAVSISSSSTTSYPPTQPDRPAYSAYPPGYYDPRAQPMMYSATPDYGMPVRHPPPQYYGAPAPMNSYVPQPVPYYQQAVPHSSSHQTNSYTRNLIGSLTVTASVLNGVDDEPGIFFILSDLSVRTEGEFRLRVNFIDLASPDGFGICQGNAPVLAHTMTSPFQVYSAKKFPGVIESTDLSKKFAEQGIKIPIRKEGNKHGQGDDDDD